MSDNVFILGAGFSHDAGIPLLSGFVERMWEFAIRKTSNGKPLSKEDIAIFDEAMQVRNELDGYHGRAMFDDRNIEDILSMLSFNVLEGEPGAQDKLKAINRAIARTIELSCKVIHPGIGRNGALKAQSEGPDVYRSFWKSVLDWKASEHDLPTIVTFNYDLVLERSLLQILIGTNYNYDRKPPFDAFRFRYHQSRIPEVVYRVQYKEYRDIRSMAMQLKPSSSDGTDLSLTDSGTVGPLDVEILKLHGSVNFPDDETTANPAHHNVAAAIDEPNILPPIFNKLSSNAPNEMWRVAIQRLRNAKNVIFVGYSLPKTDIYMQYFLKAALGPNVNLNYIFVFDPILYSDSVSEHEMRSRYEDCFAPQLRKRIYFRPFLPSSIPIPRESLGTLDHMVYLLQSHPDKILF